eukprot:636577-Alexandrium_andersonii.AAC.1
MGGCSGHCSDNRTCDSWQMATPAAALAMASTARMVGLAVGLRRFLVAADGLCLQLGTVGLHGRCDDPRATEKGQARDSGAYRGGARAALHRAIRREMLKKVPGLRHVLLFSYFFCGRWASFIRVTQGQRGERHARQTGLAPE